MNSDTKLHNFIKSASYLLPLKLRKKFMDPVYGRFVFSKFADAQFDWQGWRYVVPEIVSKNFASHFHDLNILDAYAGLGGTSIQLALAGNRVTAAEIDPKRFKCMEHNIKAYGVGEKITPWPGDVEKLLKTNPQEFDPHTRTNKAGLVWGFDMICVDPPWKDLRANGFKRYLDFYFPYSPLLVFKISKQIGNDFIFHAGASEIREIYINSTMFHKEGFFKRNPSGEHKVIQQYLKAPEVSYVFP